MNSTPSPTHEQIAQRAHQIWEKSGQPSGCESAHWVQAERELQAETSSGHDRQRPDVNVVEPNLPGGKHNSQKAAHSTSYAPQGVTADSLHHHRTK